jgi:hypothetical protein
MKQSRTPLRVLYLLPPVNTRLNRLCDVLQNLDIPERYLFYGLDYFVSAGVDVRHNLVRPGHAHKWLGCAFRRVLSGMGAYSGDLEWLLPAWRDMWWADVIVAFSDRITLPLLYLRALRILPRLPLLYITMGLPEKLAAFQSCTLKRRFLDELGRVDRIICLSLVESRMILAQGLEDNVHFLSAGVDTQYYSPI